MIFFIKDVICFKINLAHKDVKKIHFLYECQEDLDFISTEGIDTKK